MNARDLTPWPLFLLVVAISACTGDESSVRFDGYLTKKSDNVCDPGEPDYDPGDPRCQPGGPAGSGIAPPAPCVNGEPTCNRAHDYPTQFDLTIANSSNVAYSSSSGGMRLLPGSGALEDDDGDGVPDEADDCPGPGWREPCDGDPTNDGIYQTLFFDSGNEITLGADINVDGKIRTADAYILMDATASMGGEQRQLVQDLTKGTFVDPVECPGGDDTGLVGALKCVLEDVWIGLGQFNEYPVWPHGHSYGYSPYHHHLDVTDNLPHLIDAVSALTTKGNRDYPEATTQALYATVTGQGLGPWVPNRAGCPPGHWGYPCFRPTALPIVMLFTDDEMQNGPRPQSPKYGSAPLGGVGVSTRLPPVIQHPGMVYSGDANTAHDFGDLRGMSLTAMGTNARHGDNVDTTSSGMPCRACNSRGRNCWGDGQDGVITFSLSGPTNAFISSDGTFYPNTALALLDASLNMVDCDYGPGGGNWWGRLNMSLNAGRWFVVSDAHVKPKTSVLDRRGPFQIRIQTTPSDPSWATREAPVPWTDVETELLTHAVKMVQVVSPGHGSQSRTALDIEALARITGSVDQFDEPYVQRIQGDGTGLTTAVLDAVRSLVGDTRRDISVIAEDNPATPSVDESRFVGTVTAVQCPTTGINNCLGGEGTDTCLGCLADSDLRFEFRVGNDFVPSTGSAQVFEFDLVTMADGSIELSRIPFRVTVPPTGSQFGTGFYENDYDATVVCEMPSERPLWGSLTWWGSLPEDSKLEFELFTANTREELDSIIPTSVIVDDPANDAIHVGTELLADGQLNRLLFLRVRAKMISSSDLSDTPVLAGWSMQFDCVPSD